MVASATNGPDDCKKRVFKFKKLTTINDMYLYFYCIVSTERDKLVGKMKSD